MYLDHPTTDQDRKMANIEKALCTGSLTATNNSEAILQLKPKLVHVRIEAGEKIFHDPSSDSEVGISIRF